MHSSRKKEKILKCGCVASMSKPRATVCLAVRTMFKPKKLGMEGLWGQKTYAVIQPQTHIDTGTITALCKRKEDPAGGDSTGEQCLCLMCRD